MPNRILREGINSSERIDQLSDGAELLYRRLLSVADDFGRYYASPGTVRGACWPLRPERVSEDQVGGWLQECCEVGLLTVYVSGRARYLQINDFRQQTRTKSKFPEPDINLPADCSQNDIKGPSLVVFRSRISESKAYTHTQPDAESNAPPPAENVRAFRSPRTTASDLDGPVSERFEEFWQLYPRKQRKDFTAREWVSKVSIASEGAVFACLERYLASDEVARAVVANPDKWLYEQHRNDWKGDWPRAPTLTEKTRKDPYAAMLED